MKIVAIVQARMGSMRFPGKVLQPICGTPLIGYLLERLRLSHCVDEIWLATSDDSRNDPLASYVESLGISVYRGSEDDVLDRYYRTACAAVADAVVRITGDCPLIDPVLVDNCVKEFRRGLWDLVCNTNPPTYPDGLDVAVVSMAALERAWREATISYDREHVLPFVTPQNGFHVHNVAHIEDFSSERWTVDERVDFEVVRNIAEHFDPDRRFGWEDALQHVKQNLEHFGGNQHIMRNQGGSMTVGQKLWKRACSVIPGGNMLLSKRAEMFLPEQWPAYFSKAAGCKVWDLDGREYIDMSLMGIGTNTLGYGHPEVDEAVRAAISNGNMSTFNCPEEVELAERLVALHPWADMARFTRSGGEANTVALRIARAYSGRDHVAFCGYHGWHDWYLAANLGKDEGLAGHLLPGLEPLGVPAFLTGTVHPFEFNNFYALQEIVRQDPQVGGIIMEVTRNVEPAPEYLQQVRELANAHKVVLIFDECTSGFRETYGGLHKKYGVEPDMAMFGKALGNGYAINAVLGRREIMEMAQSTFISSIFWTERIGPSAALKTLEVMERTKSWEQITATGKKIAGLWENLAAKHQVPLRTFGLPSLIKFAIESPQALAYKTLITQEMLTRGYLAGNSVYVCLSHTEDVISGYAAALDEVFGLIAECESGRDVFSLLKGPVCHAEFRRLN